MALLQIDQLEKFYARPEGGRQLILRIDAFQLNAEDQMALRGESGSGKTTFLNLIAGIVRPDKGKIVLDGIEVSSLSEPARDRMRATHIGYIFQTFNLLQGYTCLENVLLGMSFGARRDRDAAAQLLKRVGLGDRLKHYPKQLSIGQQQRVAVARALANHPRLVLADEPTGALDHRNAQTALDLIREICAEQRAALLLVSHDETVLSRFNQVQNFENLNQALVS